MSAVGSSPGRGAARGSRALVLAAVAVAVAAAAHTWVDGCLDAPGILLALGLTWPGAVAVATRRRSVPVLVLWSTAAQAVTHTVLHVSCGSGEPAPSLRVLAAHGAAVVITSVVLARADRQLWLAHVVRTALARLVLPVLVPVLPGVPRLARPQDAPLPRTDPTIRHQARRGPPAALLLAS